MVAGPFPNSGNEVIFVLLDLDKDLMKKRLSRRKKGEGRRFEILHICIYYHYKRRRFSSSSPYCYYICQRSHQKGRGWKCHLVTHNNCIMSVLMGLAHDFPRKGLLVFGADLRRYELARRGHCLIWFILF